VEDKRISDVRNSPSLDKHKGNLGVDVSEYQGKIDWSVDSLENKCPVHFVFIPQRWAMIG
jgi:GH25 family lysozyme M1 (1,4-beta-N-acetylmuramidase)